jgi:MFS family permease
LSQNHQARIFTPQFNLLITGTFFFFLSFNMLLAEFPGYLTLMGGEAYKGLIIGIFTISAAISRPFSGKLADKIGRRPIIFLGLVLGAICSALYGFVLSVFAFFSLRFLHGFAVGFAPTGTNAVMADTVPVSRRGEAAGIMGLTSGVGMSLGPFVGSTLAKAYSYDVMFMASFAIGILALVLLYLIEETLPHPEKFSFKFLKISSKEVFEPRVMPVFFTVLFASFAFGAVLTLTPDFVEYVGLSKPEYLWGWGNKAIYMTVFTFSSILMRLVSGKISDRYGRPQMLVLGNVFVVVAMLILVLYRQPEMILLSAVIYGFGVGTNATMVMAWTIDLALPEHRGRAVSTMFISLEIGIGSGAFVSGFLFGNHVSNFSLVFAVCAAMNAICIVYLLTYLNRQKLQTI